MLKAVPMTRPKHRIYSNRTVRTIKCKPFHSSKFGILDILDIFGVFGYDDNSFPKDFRTIRLKRPDPEKCYITLGIVRLSPSNLTFDALP